MSTSPQDVGTVVIIGAGPAGLTAAYQLDKLGVKSIVCEKDSVVGGISRTVRYKGYHFDIGGHRFFTKVAAVERLWKEILGSDLIRRQRQSRILYRRKFFHYPLRPVNALLGLGLWNSFLLVLSYLYAHFYPIRNERTFEDWVVNRFGRRLYAAFFKTYTEKVWGISCKEISADWAAQRIRGLSLLRAIKDAVIGTPSNKDAVITTLIDSFLYPKRGPGMMWETVAERVSSGTCSLRMSTSVERICWEDGAVQAVDVAVEDQTKRIEGTHFISSMPARELVEKLHPAPPEDVLEAAAALKYRDYLTVALIVRAENLFPDNWIYIHDPDVKVGRVQNFKNWSPDMVPDASMTCIGLEYFCWEGDDLWVMPDAQLVELGKSEIQTLGLLRVEDVVDGAVVRMPKAYPVYDKGYGEAILTIRRFLEPIGNLQLVGRNGMHKYNNQDHSMVTAMLAVENIMGAKRDLWAVNVERVYHEERRRVETERDAEYADLASTQPEVPTRADPQVEAILSQAFSRMDKLAFAGAVGIVSGFYVALATLLLLLNGAGSDAAPITLLGQYIRGYTASYQGLLVGGAYGLLWGFLLGWTIAYLRNTLLGFYLFYIRVRVEAEALRHFLNYI